MDTEFLKTFLEVARTRHFGKASENLFLTRSAVSFRIKQLETELGVELFERHRHNIKLTHAGERMLSHCESILSAWERAKQDVSLSNENNIQLAVGIAPNVWGACLQYALQPIHSSLSGVALGIEEYPYEILERQLFARTLDVMIAFDAPQLDEITSVKLGHIELCLVSGAGSVDSHNLDTIPYVKVNWGTVFNIEHAKALPGFPAAIMQTSHAQLALEFIKSNGGIAFLPKQLAATSIELGELKQVQAVPTFSRNLYLVFWADNNKLEVINQMIAVLRQCMED